METANLARRDADLALRHGIPEGGNLYVSKVGVIACAVYRRTGADWDALRGAAWVTYPEEQNQFISGSMCSPLDEALSLIVKGKKCD